MYLISTECHPDLLSLPKRGSVSRKRFINFHTLHEFLIALTCGSSVLDDENPMIASAFATSIFGLAMAVVALAHKVRSLPAVMEGTL